MGGYQYGVFLSDFAFVEGGVGEKALSQRFSLFGQNWVEPHYNTGLKLSILGSSLYSKDKRRSGFESFWVLIPIFAVIKSMMHLGINLNASRLYE